MAKKKKLYPCDYEGLECPFDARYSGDCRYHCGLGVDEDEPDDDYWDDDYDRDDDYTPSSTNGDYGPSNPWDAPGMSVKDFI